MWLRAARLRSPPTGPNPFVGAGWVDYPTIFVEAGLEFPYSVEGFDQAMQNNFRESVAVALDVKPFRVKIDKINVAAPHADHARRLLAHGCEVFFSVQVPGGDEAKAQLILAVTLESVNMQLEHTGVRAALNFVGAPRIVRKPCTAGKYRVNADCVPCPSNSSSPAGSIEIQACLCDPGYTGPNGGACVTCGADTYKDAAGNASCFPCPSNSSSPAGSIGIQACLCNAVSAT